MKMISVCRKIFILIFSAATFLACGQPPVNTVLQKDWKSVGISPYPAANDALFCRRIWLNAAGRLPSQREVQSFINDKSPDKREKLIDAVIDSPQFADMTAMRLCEILRVKSEFPINLWPNAVQAYHRYLRDAIVNDRPWNQVVREMLTSSGSNFRVPAVNFMRAFADRTPAGMAEGIALSLCGVRLENFPAEDQKLFANFFSQVQFKRTDEWKEEIVLTKNTASVVTARDLCGTDHTIETAKNDPREVFADWLLAADNPYFAKAFVNRTWGWLFGKGLIDPPDDLPPYRSAWTNFIRTVTFAEKDKEPKLPETMEFLEKNFIAGNYSIKKLFRTIMNSQAYQADSTTMNSFPQNSLLKAPSITECSDVFAAYPIRRIEAEVIIDMLRTITGRGARYSSVIPEPFTYLPHNMPAVKIADGSISDGMLDNFGRSPRDSGKWEERNQKITASQRLFLMNSGQLYSQIRNRGRSFANQYRGKRFRNGRGENLRIDAIYMTVLSRKPTAAERKLILDKYKKTKSKQLRDFWGELMLALVNSAEFIYHH